MEFKRTITEMKNSLEELNRKFKIKRLKKINEFEDRSMEIIMSKKQRRRLSKRQQNLRNPLINIKHINITVIKIFPDRKVKGENKNI